LTFLFETRDLSKDYRPGSKAQVHALQGICLTIPNGSFVLLTGPSGSGKTTLLALLGALERPTQGKVLFEGHDLSDHSDVSLARLRRRMGFIFQDFALIPGLPAWDNITYPLIPRGVRRAERYERARSQLANLGLLDKLAMTPEELSGGEQQRVAVARALAGEPDVLLADEPTSNLDPGTAGALLETLVEAHAEGKTVIVSSHDPQFLPLATLTYELEAGRLKAASRRQAVAAAGEA
jgi:putative ABC transport system ATP-binding protein